MAVVETNDYAPGFVNDVNSLDALRQGAQKEDGSATIAAARQFESIFTQMMYKSMRDANHAFKSDLFENKQADFFEDMKDKQMSSELASKGSLGLADMIVEQTKLFTADIKPASPETPLLHRHVEAIPLTRPQEELKFNTSNQPSKVTRHDGSFEQLMKAIKSQQQGEEAVIGVSSAAVIEKSKNRSQEEFVRKMTPYARKTADALGVTPDVLIAQAALETGWGKHVIGNGEDTSYNLFNIKADRRWTGDKMNTLTHEVYDGVSVKENANFRSYDSYQQSFDDYVNFLQSNPRYKTALASNDSTTYVKELHKAGYATDPKYSSKILSIAERVKAMME